MYRETVATNVLLEASAHAKSIAKHATDAAHFEAAHDLSYTTTSIPLTRISEHHTQISRPIFHPQMSEVTQHIRVSITLCLV